MHFSNSAMPPLRDGAGTRHQIIQTNIHSGFIKWHCWSFALPLLINPRVRLCFPLILNQCPRKLLFLETRYQISAQLLPNQPHVVLTTSHASNCFAFKKKSLYCFSGAGLPAGIRNRGYLPHTANAPGMGCQVSRPAQRARWAARLRLRLPGTSWHEILPLLPYGPAKSEQAEIFPGCLPQASLVLLGVDFGLGFLWFGGGCWGLFCIVSPRQNSSTIAKEEAREGTSYPYLKEINCVIFHLEITNTSRTWEKDCIHADDIYAVFCWVHWVGDWWHRHWHVPNFS